MSSNLTENLGRWRGEETPITSKVCLVPIKRVYKVKSNLSASKTLPKPSGFIRKPQINQHIDTLDREYQKNIAKLMIGGYLNTEKMNSEYTRSIEKIQNKTPWRHQPTPNSFTTSTKRSGNTKFFMLDSPNTMKNIGGMMDEEETEILLNNPKLLSQMKEMTDQYQEIEAKAKRGMKKKSDSKVKKRIQDRLIRKEDAPTKEELEKNNTLLDKNSDEDLDYSHITHASTDLHDLMEKYDYIKYLEKNNEDKIFMPSPGSMTNISDNNDNTKNTTEVEEKNISKAPASTISPSPVFLNISPEMSKHLTGKAVSENILMVNGNPHLQFKNLSQPTIVTTTTTTTTNNNTTNFDQNQSPTLTLPSTMMTVAPPSSPIPKIGNVLEEDQEQKPADTTSSSIPLSKSSNADVPPPSNSNAESDAKIMVMPEKDEKEGHSPTVHDTEKSPMAEEEYSFYKPYLPQFNSKLYNNGDISLQEKILNLENSKKYGVNDKTQKFRNFFRNDKTQKFQNYINKVNYHD